MEKISVPDVAELYIDLPPGLALDAAREINKALERLDAMPANHTKTRFDALEKRYIPFSDVYARKYYEAVYHVVWHFLDLKGIRCEYSLTSRFSYILELSVLIETQQKG